MNSLERVSKILNHEEADRVPAYPLVNSIAWREYGIDYEEFSKDPEKCAAAIIKITDKLDLDVICTLVDLSVEAADWGMEMVYYPDKAASPAPQDPFIPDADSYELVKEINPLETERMSKMIKMTKILASEKGNEKPIVAFVFGPLGILSMLRGLDKMLVDTFNKKVVEKMHIALDKITNTLINYCDALIDAGSHAIMFDTLYASKTIMRAKMWDSLEGEYVQKLAEHCHERGAMVMIHNCGEGIYFKEQIERMKPEAISTLYVPADCKSFTETKEKYGSQTTIIGQINPGFLMSATEEQVRQQCRELMDAYKKDGGFILATGCEYPANMDDSFAQVMVEEAKSYGKY